MAVSELDLAWLAGLVDGEGYFLIRKMRGVHVFWYRAGLEVVMTSEAAIRKAHAITGCGTARQMSKPTKTGKTLWMWAVRTQEAAKVARMLLPYLVVKGQEAALIIQLCENIAQRKPGNSHALPPDLAVVREQCRLSLIALNQSA